MHGPLAFDPKFVIRHLRVSALLGASGAEIRVQCVQIPKDSSLLQEGHEFNLTRWRSNTVVISAHVAGAWLFQRRHTNLFLASLLPNVHKGEAFVASDLPVAKRIFANTRSRVVCDRAI